MARAALAAALAIAACGAPMHPDARDERAAVAVLVSANAEWVAVTARFPAEKPTPSPYGEWFVRGTANGPVLYFHGGWGKIAAAGGAQYVIDRFHPDLIVNLGTCGGFGDGATTGEIVLVDQAIVYDIIEQMGDADEAIRDYATKLDVGRWPAALRARVRVGHIASGDRNLVPTEVARLRDHFHAIAGDWESGAIAWVAAHNHTPVVILRIVADVVTDGGDPTYGAPDEWQRRALATMGTLLSLFDEALPALMPIQKI